MINGFEKETEPLTDLEKRLVQPFINGLKKHIGSHNVENNVHNLKQYIQSLEQRSKAIQAVADILKKDIPTYQQTNMKFN